jgi:hypothetical protein
MYQHHNTDQIAFVLEELRREAAASQLVVRSRPPRDPRFRVRPALHRLATLTRLDHLHVRPARG